MDFVSNITKPMDFV